MGVDPGLGVTGYALLGLVDPFTEPSLVDGGVLRSSERAPLEEIRTVYLVASAATSAFHGSGRTLQLSLARESCCRLDTRALYFRV